MSKRRIFELLLDSIQLNETGKKDRSGRHMVAVRLIWPRPAIAEKVAAKAVVFDSGRMDFSSLSWSERILFKETVSGNFGIEAGVTGAVSDGQLGKLLSFVGSAVLRTAGLQAEDAFIDDLPSRLVGVPFRYFGNIAGQLKKMPEMISEGLLDVDPDKQKKKEWQIEIPLISTGAVTVVSRTRRHGQLSAKKKTVLEAGQANGRIIMSAVIYD